MKREDRTKLVERIRARLSGRFLWEDTLVLRQAAGCIEQLEKELDAIHANFVRTCPPHQYVGSVCMHCGKQRTKRTLVTQ